MPQDAERGRWLPAPHPDPLDALDPNGAFVIHATWADDVPPDILRARLTHNFEQLAGAAETTAEQIVTALDALTAGTVQLDGNERAGVCDLLSQVLDLHVQYAALCGLTVSSLARTWQA